MRQLKKKQIAEKRKMKHTKSHYTTVKFGDGSLMVGIFFHGMKLWYQLRV